jgi:hypothetical protein
MEGYNDDLVMSLGIGLWVRDTALKLRQEGIDLTKNTIQQSSANKSTESPFYRGRLVSPAQSYWSMTGVNSNSKHQYGIKDEDSDIKWLL